MEYGNGKLVVKAHRNPWRARVEILVLQRLDQPRLDQPRYLASNDGVGESLQFSMEPFEEGQDHGSFFLDADAARFLMDDLWNAGIRPTEAKNTTREQAAVGRHLDDMRALVERFLKVKLP